MLLVQTYYQVRDENICINSSIIQDDKYNNIGSRTVHYNSITSRGSILFWLNKYYFKASIHPQLLRFFAFHHVHILNQDNKC